jgi:hypothetical protein
MRRDLAMHFTLLLLLPLHNEFPSRITAISHGQNHSCDIEFNR